MKNISWTSFLLCCRHMGWPHSVLINLQSYCAARCNGVFRVLCATAFKLQLYSFNFSKTLRWPLSVAICVPCKLYAFPENYFGNQFQYHCQRILLHSKFLAYFRLRRLLSAQDGQASFYSTLVSFSPLLSEICAIVSYIFLLAVLDPFWIIHVFLPLPKVLSSCQRVLWFSRRNAWSRPQQVFYFFIVYLFYFTHSIYGAN